MLQSVHQKYENSNSQKNSEGVRDQVVDVETTVGEEVLEEFGAGGEEETQEKPGPWPLLHGCHKKGPGNERQGVEEVIPPDFYYRNIIEVKFTSRRIDR